jgi:hypothetical protein
MITLAKRENFGSKRPFATYYSSNRLERLGNAKGTMFGVSAAEQDTTEIRKISPLILMSFRRRNNRHIIVV